MPELPEITVYVEALERFVAGEPLERVRVRSPSLLRTYDPPLSASHGRTVTGVRRLGKRIVFALEAEEPALYLVLHLMVTGRLRWRDPGVTIPRKHGLAAFDFPEGTLLLTEAGMKKKASLHLVAGTDALSEHDRGGTEPLETDFKGFHTAITRENRTLKRALTDPRLLSGIGNAHSDEILLDAKLSPLKRSRDLSEDEARRLFAATRASLTAWTDVLRAEVGEGFPEKVTAFHPDMAAHGKFGEPCPHCGSPIQRIKYADNETNYCATCQTDGRLLADRAFSRLLKEDWPRSLDELESVLDRDRA